MDKIIKRGKCDCVYYSEHFSPALRIWKCLFQNSLKYSIQNMVTCHFTASWCCETFPECCETLPVCCGTFPDCCEKLPVCCESFPIRNQTFSVHDNGQHKVKGWVRGISSLGVGSKVGENIIKGLKKSLLWNFSKNPICCERTKDPIDE